MPICPLCMDNEKKSIIRGMDARLYHLCEKCSLIFADSRHHMSPDDERKRYTMHQNKIDDEGYLAFLNQAIEPTLPYLAPGFRGLDYGCGPSQILSKLLKLKGISCENYDIFFAKHDFNPPYNFIFSTECFEHFREPKTEITRICKLLEPRGILTVMTELWKTKKEFSRWHYNKDTTHLSFYHKKTMDFICEKFGLEIIWQDNKRVFILEKAVKNRVFT